ncbi:universal stress protein [Sunxiuqinia sp. A32]|uniref:universal stress protein n=1 Tax=Sunxiuqinia sp. A32 TaxID=3461496 RepID=UPI004045F7E9
MKTNLLLLDSLRNVETLIYSGFSLSNQLNRKLRIVYIYDFNWISSGEFVGAVAPTIDAKYLSLEKEIKKDFEIAESKIKEITTEYFASNPINVPFEVEVAEVSRLDYMKKYLHDEKDVILLMSNYNSYADTSSGQVKYPNIIDVVGCPVLVLPDDYKIHDFNKIVYASALHEEDLMAMRHLSGLFAKAKGKVLTVFHNEKLVDFEEELKWRGFQSVVQNTVNTFTYTFNLTHEKDAREGLDTIVEKEDPDLIVLLKEKKGFFKEVFSSSETRYAVTHFDKPVLVYHEENLHK